jgi:hypothetical protein
MPAPSLEANQRTCFSAIAFTEESNTARWERKTAAVSRTASFQRCRSKGNGRGASTWRFGRSREKLGARSASAVRYTSRDFLLKYEASASL